MTTQYGCLESGSELRSEFWHKIGKTLRTKTVIVLTVTGSEVRRNETGRLG